jgi:hypothetical protein
MFKVSLHPKIVGISLLAAHVFIYSFHSLGNQYSKLIFILIRSTHIKDFKICDETWRHHCWAYKYTGTLDIVNTQKITKNGENNLFSNSCFSGKKNPQYIDRYQPWSQILKFLRIQNIYRVNWFDFKIIDTNDNKA